MADLSAYKDKDDKTLIDLISNGNELAFTTLLQRHTGSLYSMAYRMQLSQAEAEDIIQETAIKIWKKAATYDSNKGAAVRTWMVSIMYHSCIDYKRKRKELPLAEGFDAEDSSLRPDDIVAQDDLANHVQLAVHKLPERQRDAMIMCQFEGLSNKEAAEAMNITVKALESLLVRARRTLKETLAY